MKLVGSDGLYKIIEAAKKAARQNIKVGEI